LLYAYVKDHSGLEHGSIITRGNQSFIVIKSIEVIERRIEKAYDYYCLSCDKQVFFRHYKAKHDHFYHRNSPDCKLPESIEHLLVKMEIYKYLKKAGYEAKLEKTFFRGHLKARADVFAKGGKEELVVEVQASNSIAINTIRKRNTIYAGAGIPTAWVIVLDTFFNKYTGTVTTQIVKHEDGTSSSIRVDLPYDKQEVFQIIGETPKAFDFLIDKYHYVITISSEGKFFLIRKDINGTVYNITRIPTSDLVQSLLSTPLIDMDYEDSPNSKAEKPLIFLGDEGTGDHPSPTIPESIFIDFENGRLDEQERLKTEEPFDTVALIQALNKAREERARETLNELRYKPKFDYWKQQNEMIYDQKKFNFSKIKEDLEKKLITQWNAIEERVYKERFEPGLTIFKQKLKEELSRLSWKLKKLEELYLNMYKQKANQLAILKNRFTALENERIKQESLTRARIIYGEEVGSKLSNIPLYEELNQRYKERTMREREELATRNAEDARKREQERIIQERMSKIHDMEKEAGKDFTYTLTQVRNLNGNLEQQSDETFQASMGMLLASYNTIMNKKRNRPHTSAQPARRHDEINRLI
jgi:hypothetical protein